MYFETHNNDWSMGLTTELSAALSDAEAVLQADTQQAVLRDGHSLFLACTPQESKQHPVPERDHCRRFWLHVRHCLHLQTLHAAIVKRAPVSEPGFCVSLLC